jgi:hypothetical protein
MPIEPINTIPLQQFIQQVKAADTSKSKEVRLDITTAKNLAFTLGIVMSRMQGDLEKFISENSNINSDSNEVITITMDGGTSWK